MPGPDVELGGLARREADVVLAEHQPQRAVEDVGPVAALVGARLRFGVVAPGRQHELVGLDAPGAAGRRVSGMTTDPPPAAMGRRSTPRVAGGWCVDQLAEAHPVRLGQRQQLLQPGRRNPASSRERGLVEMPVPAARSTRVASRRCRSCRSRGPTASTVRLQGSLIGRLPVRQGTLRK